MKTKNIVGFLFSILLVTSLLAETTPRVFEAIQFVDHRGEPVKIHQYSRWGPYLYLVSEKNILFEFNLHTGEMHRMILSGAQLGAVSAFAALSRENFLFAMDKKLFKLRVPAFYLKGPEYPVKDQKITAIVPVDEEHALILYERSLILYNVLSGKHRVLLHQQKKEYGRFRGLRVTADGHIWVLALNALLELNLSESGKFNIKKHSYFTARDVTLDANGNLYILSKEGLRQVGREGTQRWPTPANIKGIFVDPAGGIWVYSESKIYQLDAGNFIHLPLPKKIANEKILGMAGGDWNEIFIIGREHLYCFHDILQPDDIATHLIEKINRFYTPRALWYFCQSDMQRLLEYLDRSDDEAINRRILATILPSLPQLQQKTGMDLAIEPHILRLSSQLERKTLLKRLSEQMGMENWARGVFLHKTILKNERSIKDKIRTEFEVAQLFARDTSNYPLARYLIENLIRKYDNIIFEETLKDSLYFLLLKYSRGFPFTRDPGLERYWKYLFANSTVPVIREYARQYFFKKRTDAKFEIERDSLAQYHIWRHGQTMRMLVPVAEGIWYLDTNGRLHYLDTRNGVISSPRALKRLRLDRLLAVSDRVLGITNRGRLLQLSLKGAQDFQPAPPFPVKNAWVAGADIIILGKRGKRWLISSLDVRVGSRWSTPVELPIELADLSFIYVSKITAQAYLLVTRTKAYRYDVTSRQARSIQLPPQILTISDCVLDDQRGFYFATNNGLWYYRDLDGSWSHKSIEDALPETAIRKLSFDYRNGVLAFASADVVGIQDRFGWMLFRLPPLNVTASPPSHLQFDAQLNLYVLQETRSVVWQRNLKLDLNNMVARLMDAEDYFHQRRAIPHFIQLLKRAERIQELSDWASVYQALLYIRMKKYKEAVEIYQLKLGGSRAHSSEWLSDMNFLVLVDQLFDQQKWETVLDVSKTLFPYLRDQAVRSLSREYYLKKMREGGPRQFTRDKLELALWLRETTEDASFSRKLEYEIQQLLMALYMARDAEFEKYLSRVVRNFSQSTFLPIWYFLWARYAYDNGNFQKAVQYITNHVEHGGDRWLGILSGPFYLRSLVQLVLQ
ncbi:MAG: hypothetical protein GXO78_05790 [Calditrichaeota bacterium]|nr:hypothetical protein [Calditrichota bacterium]